MRKIRFKRAGALAGLALLLISSPAAFSHCEIPCGIYDDQMRIGMLLEDIATIERSINALAELTGKADKNYNQIVRWVNNKEHHADDIREIVSQYFLAQRIKEVEADNSPEYQKYVRELSLLHQMLVYAMKSKQTTDLANVEKLRELVEKFNLEYFGENPPEHKH
ncbi:MAG: superoxide dismutase, Ni [candidate division Zixibacteria bacterium]|nr:superoxide dismutase, Ni [candidate division Zixibacteria bacterium]